MVNPKNSNPKHCIFVVMRFLKIYIGIAALLFFSNLALAQVNENQESKSKGSSNGYFDKVRGSTLEQQLDRANKLKSESPIDAIQILEDIFKDVKRTKSPKFEAEAYFLLGEIYEQTGQKELALNRYESAYNLVKSSKNKRNQLPHLLALGNINLKLGYFSTAENYFTICQEVGSKAEIVTQCQEGLVDVSIKNKNFEQGYSQNLEIQNSSNYPFDSILQSRTEARNVVIYSNQNKPKKAKESYDNSIKQLPKTQLTKKDIEPLQRAKENLVQSSNSLDDRIKFNEQVLSSAGLPEELKVETELQIAELYIEKGNLDKAEEHIGNTYEWSENIRPKQKADIYKQSASLKNKRGDYTNAEADYSRFVEEQNKVLANKELEVKQLIQILKGQGKIDLMAKDIQLEEKESDLLKSRLATQRIVIGLMSLLLLLASVAYYFIYKNVRAKRKANRLLTLKSLRTQMNPHFIFNALNSVNNFVSKSDERSANKFLTDFSKLMRLVLNHSQKDFIALDEELNLIDLYLKLEHQRFRDKFTYSYDRDPELSAIELNIPPMLIQPFIENAIWHGLRYKEEMGELLVKIYKKDNAIHVLVKDNGIGRDKSMALKTMSQSAYKSQGMKNVNKRLDLFNELYNKQYQIAINDLHPGTEDPGTEVHLQIPIT